MCVGTSAFLNSSLPLKKINDAIHFNDGLVFVLETSVEPLEISGKVCEGKQDLATTVMEENHPCAE
jgi:hypothetical protein